MRKTAKITNTQYKEQIKKSDIKSVGEYQGANIKHLHQCKKCSHQWMVKPSHIKNGQGCPLCVGSGTKITNDQYKEQIKKSDIKSVGEYQGANTKHLHQCKKCSHQWMVRPSHIKNGQGCPLCAGQYVPTNEEYKEQIKNTSVISIERYQGTMSKILHQCKKCSHRWMITPANIKNGQGCPICADRLKAKQSFSNKPTYHYYIKIEQKKEQKIFVQFKTGICRKHKNHKDINDSLRRRYSNEYRDNSIYITLLNHEFHEDGYNAYLNEQIIVKGFSNLRIKKEHQILGSGYTETYYTDVLK